MMSCSIYALTFNKVYAPINVLPLMGKGGQPHGILTFSLEKVQIPQPRATTIPTPVINLDKPKLVSTKNYIC